jgi:hypothetical protein
VVEAAKDKLQVPFLGEPVLHEANSHLLPEPQGRRLPGRGVGEAASTSKAIWAGRVTGAFRQPMSNFKSTDVVLFPDRRRCAAGRGVSLYEPCRPELLLDYEI